MPFVKGQSGNPTGRPKVDPELRELARAASPEALQRAIELIRSPDENVALKAITVVLDRGYGKPVQEINATVTRSHEDMLAELERMDAGLPLALPMLGQH